MRYVKKQWVKYNRRDPRASIDRHDCRDIGTLCCHAALCKLRKPMAVLRFWLVAGLRQRRAACVAVLNPELLERCSNRGRGSGAVRKKAPRRGLHWRLNGAEEKTRTSDPRITNALLYQLSYFGTLERARSIAAHAAMGKTCRRRGRVSCRPGCESTTRYSRCACLLASAEVR